MNETDTTNNPTCDVISVVPIEMFTRETLQTFKDALLEAAGGSLASATTQTITAKDSLASATTQTIVAKDSPTSTTTLKVAQSLSEICDIEYEIYEVPAGMQIHDCAKTTALLAFQTNGTSMCLITIAHANAMKPSDLKALRKTINTSIEKFSFGKSANTEDAISIDLSGSIYETLKKILEPKTKDFILEAAEYTDYIFTFFVIFAAKDNHPPPDELFEHTPSEALEKQPPEWFRCDWSTLAATAGPENYKDRVATMIAMEILVQSLWNKYDKLSKLSDQISRQSMKALKRGWRHKLDRRSIDLETHTMPEGIDDIWSSKISQDNITILKAIEATSLLEAKARKLARSRNSLQYIEEAEYQAAELKSQATIQWLLVLISVFSVASAFFTIKPTAWLELEGGSLWGYLIVTLALVALLLLVVSIQRIRNWKQYRHRGATLKTRKKAKA